MRKHIKYSWIGFKIILISILLTLIPISIIYGINELNIFSLLYGILTLSYTLGFALRDKEKEDIQEKEQMKHNANN